MIGIRNTTTLTFIATCGTDRNKELSVTTYYDEEKTTAILNGLACMPKVPAIKAARAIFNLDLADGVSFIDQLHKGFMPI